MKPAKLTVYVYGTVLERIEKRPMAVVRIAQPKGPELAIMTGLESSRWLEAGTAVSIRIRQKRPAAAVVPA